MSKTKVFERARVNVTPEEVLSKILNKVSDEENDDIEGIASLSSDDYKNYKNRTNIT